MSVLQEPYASVVRFGGRALACAGVVGLLLVAVSARHQQREAEARACHAELAALKARNPVAARLGPLPADACVALQQLVAR